MHRSTAGRAARGRLDVNLALASLDALYRCLGLGSELVLPAAVGKSWITPALFVRADWLAAWSGLGG